MNIWIMLGFKKMFLIALFLIASSISFLYALTYDQCFEIERLKAQRDGASFQESVGYAKNICKNKLKKQKFSTKPNFYIGSAVNIIEDSKLDIRSTEKDNQNETTDISLEDDKKRGKRGTGVKIGARFTNWRASWQEHTFQIQDFKSSLRLVIFDYLHPSGFFVGGGAGTGRLKNELLTLDGTTRAANIGYEFSITPQLLIEFGYLHTSSNIKRDTAKFNYTFMTWSTYADISYIF